MKNVTDLKSKSGITYRGHIIDTKIECDFVLLDKKDFFYFINGNEIDYKKTDAIITPVLNLDGWAIGLKINDPAKVIMQCDRRGKIVMYRTIDSAHNELFDNGLGLAIVYGCPINTDNREDID